MSTRGQTRISRADLHCHSTASQVSQLGVQRALGLPDCATPPEEVYELAKRRGMDFVTITDHDTISGALEIADRYVDAFVSEELTAWFKDEPQAVHVLCFGIAPEDHEWLQAHAKDVEEVAEYLADRRIASALAHPFYAVEAPLLPRHRRRLAELFGVWEVRNGLRARELNMPAGIYIDTHGGTGIGGSDDHAGIDVGRTWTETPETHDWRAFLEHVRRGRAEALGSHGSAAKWAHSAIALAIRSLDGGAESASPDPAAVLRMIERVMAELDHRRGAGDSDLGPQDAQALLHAWLTAVELDPADGDLIARMQADEFSHEDLFRRARRKHECKLAAAVGRLVADADPARAALDLFEACVAAIPYVPSAAFLGREKTRLTARDYEPARVALVVDGVEGFDGRDVPGFTVEVIGTGPNVDRRLGAVAEVEVAGMRVGVPSVPTMVDAISGGRYDLVHLGSRGPASAIAALVARTMELPIVGSGDICWDESPQQLAAGYRAAKAQRAA